MRLSSRRNAGAPRRTNPNNPRRRQQPLKAKGPTLRERLLAFRRRHARQLRLGLLVGVLVLIGAGAAYAVTNAVTGGTNSHHQANANGPQNAWLGIEMVSSPSGGVMVARVDPKSPAQAAGIKPGDVITQIDTQPIVTPAIAAAAISGLEPGDHADIQVQRGAGSYTAHVTLARPPKTS